MNPNFLGGLMLASGVLLAIGGVTVLVRGNPGEREDVVQNSEERSHDEVISDGGALDRLSQEKGRKFEEWVVKRFNRDVFKIAEWRGDKFVDGLYAESSTFPDLEIEFQLRGVKQIFAVECKWRQGYMQGEKPYIVWADERQIDNYAIFSKKRGISVFVVIGVGGESNDPAEVFVVPLHRLKYTKATSEYLARFRRKDVGRSFFYDDETSELR